MIAVRMVLCSLFTILITIGAFLQIPLPGFGYFTLQFFLVLMAGTLLGVHLGALSAALYVLTDLPGIPVFAVGGGISHILHPSFGFLLDFIVTAFYSSQIMQHGRRKWKTCLLAVLARLLVIHEIELAYKYVILNYYTGTEISLSLLLLSCFPLNLPKDILYNTLAVYVALRFPVAAYRDIRREGVYARRIQR